MRKITIVIPARANSKGIKRKNLQTVNGDSLIKRAVRTVCRSKAAQVYVYSDSDRMLKEGVENGAIAARRPDIVSGDNITTEQTIQRFIQDNEIKGAVMVVQCTTPFLKTKYIDRALHKWQCGKYDSVVSVVVNQRFNGDYIDADNEFLPHWPLRSLRQDMEERKSCWYESGAFYLASRELWMSGQRIGKKCGVVVMHPWEGVEIDEEIDLKIANAIAPIVEEL